MFVLETICVLLLAVLSLAVGYLYFLALVAVFSRKAFAGVPDDYSFLILVPAHNEETGITATLESLSSLEKPGRAQVVVIADNCTDKTAQLARQAGVQVLERFDEINRGKGFALEWAMSTLNLGEFDAVAIIDADTFVEPGMLTAMASALMSGHGAVQLNYRFVAAAGEPLSCLQEMASHVENMLFYRGRAVFNLPILLRGSGMAIRTEVIRDHPWDSHSITEDVDYAVNLIRKSVSITFSAESAVDSLATSTYRQFQGQKKRWASGTILMVREKTLPLLKQGCSQGRLKLIELALSFLLLSRPAMVYMVLPVIILSLFASDAYRLILIGWCLGLVLAIVAYLLLGIFYVKSKWSAVKALLHLPVYIFWYLKVSVRAALDHKQSDWVRTDRK